MWEKKYIQIEDVNYFIRVKRGAKSEAVYMLLHGHGWTGELWSGFAKQVDRNVTLIAPDMAGHGESGRAESYQFRVLSKHLKEIAESLGEKRLIIVASSWGAALGVTFASMYPEMTEHLFLLDGGYEALKGIPELTLEMLEDTEIPADALSSLPAYFDYMRSDNPQFWDQDIEAAVRDQVCLLENGTVVPKLSNAAATACMRELYEFDPDEEKNRVRNTAVTVVVALDEGMTPEIREQKCHISQVFMRELSYMNKIEMENTDHLIMFDKPKLLADLIMKERIKAANLTNNY